MRTNFSLIRTQASTFLFLFLLFSFFEIKSSYTFNGFEIRDLEHAGSSFLQEANTFEVYALASGSSRVMSCTGLDILGGFGVLGSVCGLNPAYPSGCSQWGNYFQKTYSGLPTHSFIHITLSFWAVGNWNFGADYMEFQFDNTIITGWSMNYPLFTGTACTQESPGVIKIFAKLAHSPLTLTVKFISRMDQETTNESWGIRDLNILFVQNPPAVSDSYCAIPWTAPNIPAAWKCATETNEYYGSILVPQSCDPSCATCFGAGPNRCYRCKSGYFWNGDNCVPCHSSCSVCFGTGEDKCNVCKAGYFRYPDNTCKTGCAFPLLQTPHDTTGVQLPVTQEISCTLPCETGEFLNWFETCQATCDLPLQSGAQTTILGDVFTCSFSCNTAPNTILYWDASCQSSCPAPFKILVVLGKLICTFPCNTAPNTIVYWDQSCESSCPLPFQTQIFKGKTRCLPSCSSIGYWDGSCETTCPPPLKAETYKWKNLCTFPCNTAPNTILYWDQSCQSTCSLPLLYSTSKGKEFCNTPCTNHNDYLFSNGSCFSTCQEYYTISLIAGQKLCGLPCQDGYILSENDKCVLLSLPLPLPPALSNTTKTVLKNSQIASSATVQIASAVNSGRAISISAGVGGRIFYNIKFLNISYSAELQQALKDWLPSFISLGLTPDLPESTVKRVPDRSVPPTFEKYGVDASFFLNFWENLGILLMIACACVLLKLFEFLIIMKLNQVQYFQAIIKKLKILMQNFLMATLYGIYGDLVLFAILEYRTLEFNFDFSALSFGMAFVLIIIMFVCLAFHYKLLNKYQKIKDQPDLLEAFDKDYEGVQAIYKDFEDKSLRRQGFLILLTLREIAFSIIISTLFGYPIIQAEIFLVNSIFMMIYLIKENPFKSKFDYFQQIFFEIIGLIVNVGVFINCFQSGNNLVETKTVWTIGRMIIIMNLIFNFSSAGLMLIQIIMIIKDHWNAYKEKKAKRSRVINHVEEEPNEVQGKSLTIQTEPSVIGETFRNEKSRFIRQGSML